MSTRTRGAAGADSPRRCCTSTVRRCAWVIKPERASEFRCCSSTGSNIELLEPIAGWMPQREIVTFDIPGVGHSPLPVLPYRLNGIAGLATQVLDHFGQTQADVLGVSWGGAVAQQFARSHPERCRRVILCATSTGTIMVPSNPLVALKLATPLRFINKRYAQRVAGEIYGGDFRRSPDLLALVGMDPPCAHGKGLPELHPIDASGAPPLSW